MPRQIVPIHRRPDGISGTATPPQDLLLRHIDMSDNHWLWDHDDGFYETEDIDGKYRFAQLVWAPPGHAKARFIVARLMWETVNGSIKRSTKLLNTCGSCACVNPAHHAVEAAIATLSARIPPAYCTPGDAPYVRLVSGRPRRGSANASLVHIQYSDASYSLCGSRKVRCVDEQPIATPVTCRSCLAEWRASGRGVLEETP